MAYHENCHVTIKNLTGDTMTYDSQHLDYGKFESPGQPPVGSIKNKAIAEPAFAAYGRDNSPSGTEGWVKYKIGDDTKATLKIGWNCSYGVFTDPTGTYSLEASDGYTAAVYGGGTSSGQVNISVLVVKD